VAEVNDNGEVTIDGEFVGKIEGFRFRPDKGAGAAEDKTIKTAALQALAPQFHLRADRFYNAPDTEIDFTEQGGLMWGSAAIGKLTAGPDGLRPQVEVFVDDVAGPEVVQKVQRRLQHFIDRKVASLFEPLIALQKDETLAGLARGFAFRMVESFGVLPRAEVMEEVKALDQDARAVLRKHGIRFGQYTIFLPLLLKPAPTRLRLVLWSLQRNLSEFPESPPPGLVTIPVEQGAPQGADTMSGYRNAGSRAIRIDMLERLADMLRAEDSRSGFEAKADMLSITGMTLEQFAELMQGLGYATEKGERPKVKAVDKVIPDSVQTETETEEVGTVEEPQTAEPISDTPVMDRGRGEDAAGAVTDETEPAEPADIPKEISDIEAEGLAPIAEEAAQEPEVGTNIPETPAEEIPVGTAPDANVTGPEMESYYLFSWARAPRGDRGPRRDGGKPQAKKGPRGKKPGPKGAAPKTQSFSAKPPRKEKQIDPDNPFAAALMGLKDNK